MVDRILVVQVRDPKEVYVQEWAQVVQVVQEVQEVQVREECRLVVVQDQVVLVREECRLVAVQVLAQVDLPQVAPATCSEIHWEPRQTSEQGSRSNKQGGETSPTESAKFAVSATAKSLQWFDK